MIALWIWLLAVLPGLSVNAVVVFEQRPGTTCGVAGGEAHLVWEYDDAADTVNVIRWYDGPDTGPAMGRYLTGAGTFDPYGDYSGNIAFKRSSSARFKSAILTFNMLQDTDAGTYTTVFQATTVTNDVSILEVAEASDFLGWDICVDGTCNAISDPLTLSASADVKVRFIKGGALTCDMDIDVKPSVGDSFRLVVPEGSGETINHALADPATLLAAGSLSIDLTFGKNGEVFYNHTIAAVSVIPDGGGPAPWIIAVIVISVLFLVVIIVIVVIVVVRKKRAVKTQGKESRPLQGQKNPEQTPPGNQTHLLQGQKNPEQTPPGNQTHPLQGQKNPEQTPPGNQTV